FAHPRFAPSFPTRRSSDLVWRIGGGAPCHVRNFSVCGLRVGRARAPGEFLCGDAGRTHDLGVTDQFRGNWSSRKGFADYAEWSLRRAGSKSHSDRLAEFSHYSGLLSSRGCRLSLLLAQWLGGPREITRDATGSSHAGT